MGRPLPNTKHWDAGRSRTRGGSSASIRKAEMARNLLIDAVHEEETRVVVLDGGKVEMFDFETSNKKQIVGNIYLAKVARVEPALQAVFVEYGGNRHGFLAFSEIHPDYYRLPVALREQDKADAESQAEAEAPPDASSASGEPDPEAKAETDSEADDGGERNASISGMEVIMPGQVPGSKQDSETTVSEDARKSDASPESEREEHDPESGAEDDSETSNIAETSADAAKTSKKLDGERQKNQRKFRVQEVIYPRQILLVQAVKDERGSKGAALTTYISLAGRYCVLMPNTPRGGGISRKITNAADRKKLEDIASGLNLPSGSGLIVRTAGAKRTKQEIKRDYDFLSRQWEQVRQLTLKSIAPKPIFEEGGLIQRSVRDLYSKDIDKIVVQGAKGYRIAKDFMKLIMPSHAKKVQQYSESTPLFARYEVEPFLAGLYSSVAQLSSGGYIVINPTEALISIDVNSGRATSHGSLEQTALQTNLEAAEEIARQLRLRDLAGLIVIDFIDMESRQHNSAVEKKLKEKTKLDRARVQVGRISNFGLLEMSRQRLRPGITEMTSTTCSECGGSGIVRSDESLALAVLRNIEAKCARNRGGEILAKVPVRIANYIMNRKRSTLDHIESAYNVPIRVYANPASTGTDFSVERLKNEFEAETSASEMIVSMESSLQSEPENDDFEHAEAQKPGTRKRRRRGGRKRSRGANGADNESASRQAKQSAETEAEPKPDSDKKAADANGTPTKSRSRRRSRGSGRQGKADQAAAANDAPSERFEQAGEDAAADKSKADNRRRDEDGLAAEQTTENALESAALLSERSAPETVNSVEDHKTLSESPEYSMPEGKEAVAASVDSVPVDLLDPAVRSAGPEASSAHASMNPLELAAEDSSEGSNQSEAKAEFSVEDMNARNDEMGPRHEIEDAQPPGDGDGAKARTGWWSS